MPHGVPKTLHLLEGNLVELLEKRVLVSDFVLRGLEVTAKEQGIQMPQTAVKVLSKGMRELIVIAVLR